MSSRAWSFRPKKTEFVGNARQITVVTRCADKKNQHASNKLKNLLNELRKKEEAFIELLN